MMPLIIMWAPFIAMILFFIAGWFGVVQFVRERGFYRVCPAALTTMAWTMMSMIGITVMKIHW